jgi:hypothetical protein
MSKKLIMACLGVFAFAAFVLPTVASAAPELTHPTGTRLATGTKITATNVGNALFKEDGGFGLTLAECTNVKITGELTKNNGTEVEGTVSTATFQGAGSAHDGMNECSGLGSLTPTTNGGGVDENTVAEGTPWCVRATSAMAADEFQVSGGACGGAARKITFILETTSFGACKYERTAATGPIKGTFTTDTGTSPTDAIMHLAAGANTTFTGEAGNPGGCPTNGVLQMSFTLETDTSTAEPLYFS